MLLITSLGANCEITFDGTLGSRANLPGPDYLIGADLGRQHGGNLFHSFQNFNLNRFESATFSGPNSVSNIISRVTGGNLSNIDGLISATIPNADMYFLNPYGFMFGPNARLDVQGSFHASTADYLRLGDGGRFEARYPSESLLTVAPVEVFGFLTDTPASITTQNSMLSVSKGNTLSLIGGDLRLTGDSPIQFDEMGFEVVSAHSELSTASGRINLASVASKGEVILSKSELDLQAEGGEIVANNTLFDISGSGSGSIFIRGGRFLMRDSSIWAHTLAEQDGNNMDMNIQESIHITGDLAAISNITLGSGHVGHIDITTPHLEIIGSIIDAGSKDIGDAGAINIKATDVLLRDGAMMTVGARGSGAGGSLDIQASNSLSLLGLRKGTIVNAGREMTNFPCFITGSTYGSHPAGNITITTNSLNTDGYITANTHGKGKAGNIIFNVDNMNLTGEGFITSVTEAKGSSGNIRITATDTVLINGRNQSEASGDPINTSQSYIGTYSYGDGQAGNVIISASTFIVDDGRLSTATGGDGAGGNIVINVKNLQVNNSGTIDSNTTAFFEKWRVGNGKGGNIKITANDITVSGTGSSISTDTFNVSSGGNVNIETNKLTVTDYGTISAKSQDTGNAGQIIVQAHTVKLANQGNISTEAENAVGGNITVITPNRFYLQNGQITTSVGTGKGKGGNITIKNPHFVILNKSKLQANADEGQGGDIYIKSEQFIASQNSSVSASSKLGIDGEIKIDSPDVDISGAWLILPAKFVDASGKLKPPCNARVGRNKNSFVAKRFAGGPSNPSDLQANMLILVQPEDEKMPLQKTGGKKDAGQSVLKAVSFCRPDSSQASSVIPEQLF